MTRKLWKSSPDSEVDPRAFISWVPDPDELGNDVPLGAAQLNASCPILGSFTYTPISGTVIPDLGPYTLSALFTPADPVRYRTVTVTADITVIERIDTEPLITWVPDPADLDQDSPLTTDQLNATCSVPGTFVYDPPLGTIMSDLGVQTLSATFTPDDLVHYKPATVTTTVTVVVSDLTYDFRFTVDTTKTGVSGSNQFKLPLVSGLLYDFEVDWGDGNTNRITAWNQAEATHTFASSGVKNITITKGKVTNGFGGWAFKAGGDCRKLTDITKWGSLPFGQTAGALQGCENLTTLTAIDYPAFVANATCQHFFRGCFNFNSDIDHWDVSNVVHMGQMFELCMAFDQPLDSWDVSNVTNMFSMFMNCTIFNQNLNSWDTGGVTDMRSMFAYCNAFNGSIGSWDVSSVTSMSAMFQECFAFNQSLNSWNVGNVTDMSDMFTSCTIFNGAIGSWDVSKVTDMSAMFLDTGAFNQDLGSWNVSSVTTMQRMFSNSPFNGNITSWNVSNVTDMSEMFSGCSFFNQNIGSWNVSSVIYMNEMFYLCGAFNQNLNSWNTANVVYMTDMFGSCYVFNGNISSWNTAKVTDMSGMFYKAYAFNQDITGWDVSKVASGFYSMFALAPSFKQDISLWSPTSVVADGSNFDGTYGFLKDSNINAPGTSTRIDSLYTSWAGKALPNNLRLRAGTGVGYSFAGSSGRATLINNGWTITGDVSRAVTFSSDSGKLKGTYVTDVGTGTRVRFTTDTMLPTGLSVGTDYWTIRLSSTTCRYATSLSNALAGTAINYADAGTGTHAQHHYAFKVAASSSSGKLMLTLNGSVGDTYFTGRKVRFVSSGTLPTGITAGTDYWINRLNATTFTITAASPKDAYTNTNLVTYTDAGTGNHEVIYQ